ncbi:hypothetical protein GTO89_03245 [Heliobacterium gestii]|uniref:Uncharacterized protein n=1 Tax=Heliomicrobium gestii TaxID=2699 RepID=A0A845L8Y2_HELGE|nr:hypothetical protein [Heliomicrobium gestii]MBM7865808.1 DNA anti-recombination protein RmuC [Heliomicrobium gestii]MZP42051.1 hypothetical protein [Heliomicrobium gestii]
MNDNKFQSLVLQALRDLKDGQQRLKSEIRGEINSLKQEMSRRFDRLERSQENNIKGMLKTINRKIDDVQEDQRSTTAIIGT